MSKKLGYVFEISDSFSEKEVEIFREELRDLSRKFGVHIQEKKPFKLMQTFNDPSLLPEPLFLWKKRKEHNLTKNMDAPSFLRHVWGEAINKNIALELIRKYDEPLLDALRHGYSRYKKDKIILPPSNREISNFNIRLINEEFSKDEVQLIIKAAINQKNIRVLQQNC